MKRILTGMVVATVLVLGLTAVGYAPYHTTAQSGDLKTQVTTAVTHSGFAGSGTSLAYVHQHLGHALNCLEGKQGKNFNAAWGNVCEGQGNGILVDLRTASGGGALLPVADHAAALALQGVKSTDLNQAKFAAQGTGALLKVLADNVK